MFGLLVGCPFACSLWVSSELSICYARACDHAGGGGFNGVVSFVMRVYGSFFGVSMRACMWSCCGMTDDVVNLL